MFCGCLSWIYLLTWSLAIEGSHKCSRASFPSHFDLWSCEIKSFGFHSVLLPVYLVSSSPYRTLLKIRKTSQKMEFGWVFVMFMGFSGPHLLWISSTTQMRDIWSDSWGEFFFAYSWVFHFGFYCFCFNNYFWIFTKVVYA